MNMEIALTLHGHDLMSRPSQSIYICKKCHLIITAAQMMHPMQIEKCKK